MTALLAVQIKDYSGSAAELGLYFVVEEDVLGRTVEHELLPRGRELPVTDSNKLMYVYLCAHWHISRINSSAAKAFSTGLSRVIPISFLRMFTVVEVNELLGGTAAADGISVPDMQEHCQYKGGYSRSSSTVRPPPGANAVSDSDAGQRIKAAAAAAAAPCGRDGNARVPCRCACSGVSLLASLRRSSGCCCGL